MTNIFGRWLSDHSTSYPMWSILRGKIMTKIKGHRSESVQSTVSIWAEPNDLANLGFLPVNFGMGRALLNTGAQPYTFNFFLPCYSPF